MTEHFNLGATAPVPMESGVVVGSGVGYHYPLCLASLFHFESNSVCFFRYLFYALQVRNVWEHLKKTRFKFLFSCNHLLDLQFFFFFYSIQFIIFPSLFLDHVFYLLKLNILQFAL